MKKKKVILSIVSIVVIIIICSVVWLYKVFVKSYDEIIKANWDINLPKGYEEVYEKDDGPSFNGDGERYHIFRYKDIEKVNECLRWYIGTNEVVRVEVEEVLGSLEVPEDMWPKLTAEYKYYYKREEDSSKLYLILSEEAKEVYVVEDIF